MAIILSVNFSKAMITWFTTLNLHERFFTLMVSVLDIAVDSTGIYITYRIKPRFPSAFSGSSLWATGLRGCNSKPRLTFCCSRILSIVLVFIFIDRNCRGRDGQNERWQTKAASQLFVHNWRKKKTLNSASSGPIFSWSPAAQCLTVFLSEDMVLRTTKSSTVSLQQSSYTVKKIDYNEPLYIYLRRTHFYIIVLCHWHIKAYHLQLCSKETTLHRAPVLRFVLTANQNWNLSVRHKSLKWTYSTRVFVGVEPT